MSRVTLVVAATLAIAAAACVPPPPPPVPEGQEIVAMSFNIHHGVGIDAVLDLDRIAATVSRSGAEVIGLQEVDRHFAERSSFVDQATYLADSLGMQVVFGANLDLDPLNPGQPRRQYGNAILSRFPIISWSNTLLPLLPGGEQRGLLEATLDIDGVQLNAYSTHLQHDSQEPRVAQVDAITELLAASKASVLLLGDLNATPDTPEIATMVDELTDTWVEAGVGDGFTYSTTNPSVRIDYVLTSADIAARTAAVVTSDSSDHLPVVATVVLPLHTSVT
ncbi:MAG: endonuclease/exonuclease/phosphatase family protein [Acidimicrobiales bacterium]